MRPEQPTPSEDELQPDIWSRRWASPSLQSLGRWLDERHISDEESLFAVENIWTFYSFRVLPAYQELVPMGLGAKTRSQPNEDNSVWVYLPSLDDQTPSGVQNTTVAIRTAFNRDVALQVARSFPHSLTLDLTFLPSGQPTEFAERFSAECRKNGQEMIGLYQDQLEEELRNCMPGRSFREWLHAPSSLLGGRRPDDILRSGNLDDKKPLRELVFHSQYLMFS